MVLLGKNRDRLCIVAAVLEATNSGVSKTRVIFGEVFGCCCGCWFCSC